jgi:ferredoxin--NADP+ reductase
VHEDIKLIKRAYSIGSSPEHKEYLELYIALVPDGGLTPRLANLQRGDRLFVSPKITGTFTLKNIPEDNSATIVMVATGTGLAPFMSMLRTKSSWHPQRSFALIHGVRFEKDLAYRDELMKLEESSGKLRYFPVVSRETPYSGGTIKGRVLTVFERQLLTLNPSSDHVLLCGNPAMIEDAQNYLEPLGFSVYSKKNPTGNLHLEKYW